MKVASERVGGNLFTHTASVATSTKSKIKVASERRRDMKASVATTEDLSSQRSLKLVRALTASVASA